MKTGKTNIYAIDALRSISILAVILIHTSSRSLELIHFNLNQDLFALFLNQISRFAVPLFFLISGFVLELNYDSDVKTYYKKRISKILVPYVFWSVIYFFFIYRDSDNFVRALLTGSASFQLYFIPSLLIFYLIFPVLHVIYRYIVKRWSLVFLGGVEMAILYQEYHVKNFTIPFPLAVALFNYYVFLIGMVTSHGREKIMKFVEKFKYLFVVGTIGSITYVFWEGYSRYYQTWNIDAFYSSWRPSTLIYTLFFAGLGYYFFEKTHFGEKFFSQFSKLSFFVFFVHVMIVELVNRFIGISNNVILFLLVSGISFLVAFLAHKIPYLNRITG